MLFFYVVLCFLAVTQIANASIKSFSFVSPVFTRFTREKGLKSTTCTQSEDSLNILAAVLPGRLKYHSDYLTYVVMKLFSNYKIGDPLVTGTIAQGVINGISLYSNILLAR